MYIYKIGYWSYEESEYDYLLHPEKISYKRLSEMIHEASVSMIEKKKGTKEYLYNFSDIFRGVVYILIENYGFSEIKIEGKWTCFGWPSIFDNSHWRSDRDKNLKSLTKYINSKGYSMKDDNYLSEKEEVKSL